MLSLDKIYQASFILKKVLHSTELVYAPKLVPGCELYIKPENLLLDKDMNIKISDFGLSAFVGNDTYGISG